MRFAATTFVALCLALAGAVGARGAAVAAPGPCDVRVSRGVLPVWARTGFSDPKPRIAHVIGASGRIAAILFGYPLRSPPAKDRSNKILWVSRDSVKPLSGLRIEAQRLRGARRLGAVVRRTVAGGPGPSIIDLPAAGCWRLTLRWSGRVDTLDLRYVRRG